MEIIKYREPVTDVSYSHEYHFADDQGAGYSFPCDAAGNLLVDKDNTAAMTNYQICQLGRTSTGRKIIDDSIRKYEHTYMQNAVGRCSCGADVDLYDQYMAACQCPKCGQWYNLMGQELVPPDQWEEPLEPDDYY